jgi:hypothetical protein
MAGAGSAVFNTVRQVGAAFGSAIIAALIVALIGREPDEPTTQLPDAVKGPFADAMAHSMLLPASAAALGALTTLLFVGRRQSADHAVTPSIRPKWYVGVAQ